MSRVADEAAMPAVATAVERKSRRLASHRVLLARSPVDVGANARVDADWHRAVSAIRVDGLFIV